MTCLYDPRNELSNMYFSSLTLPTLLEQFNLHIFLSSLQPFSLIPQLTSCLEWKPEEQPVFWGCPGLAPLILALSAAGVAVTSKRDKCIPSEQAVCLNAVSFSLCASPWGGKSLLLQKGNQTKTYCVVLCMN